MAGGVVGAVVCVDGVDDKDRDLSGAGDGGEGVEDVFVERSGTVGVENHGLDVGQCGLLRDEGGGGVALGFREGALRACVDDGKRQALAEHQGERGSGEGHRIGAVGDEESQDGDVDVVPEPCERDGGFARVAVVHLRGVEIEGVEAEEGGAVIQAWVGGVQECVEIQGGAAQAVFGFHRQRAARGEDDDAWAWGRVCVEPCGEGAQGVGVDEL